MIGFSSAAIALVLSEAFFEEVEGIIGNQRDESWQMRTFEIKNHSQLKRPTSVRGTAS